MKLFHLLKALQPTEHKDFEKFLQSPFFKASGQYLQFFRFLCKHHPSFELEKADLLLAYRRCFKQPLPTDSRLYNLLSGLSKQVEQFLVVQMVLSTDGNTQSPLHKQLLVKALGMRNMGDYFRKEARQLIAETATRPAKEIDDYLVTHQLHHEVYYNPDTSKLGEHHAHLQLAVEQLDLYYCLAKLRYAAEMKARERILHVRYELPLLEAVLQHSATPGLVERHPLLDIYYHLVVLYQQGVSERGFRELKTVFTEKFTGLPQADQATLLRHLINVGISLLARGEAVEVELLSLYKLAMGANMLLQGNRITHLSFINITNLASLCREFDWAKAFMAGFSPYLEESKRQPAIDLAQAGLYYNQGLLDEAQGALTPTVFMMSSFNILSRILLLKIAFDRYSLQGVDYEFLTAQLTAFEKFVRSKPLTPEKKAAYLNLIKFMRKILSIKFEMAKVPAAKKALLLEKLKQLKPIVSRRWLEERIAAL